jgi:hypothetical protein
VDHLVEQRLPVERHHRLQVVPAQEVDGLAARDGHPDLDRTVDRARHAGDLAQAVAPIVHLGRERVVLAPVAEGLLSNCSSKSSRLAAASSSGAPKVSISRV